MLPRAAAAAARTALVLAALLVGAAPPSADAQPPLRALRAHADVIVVGVCESVQSRWDPVARLIVTDAVFAVDRSVKGPRGPRVVITEPGGALPELNLRLTVPHAPTFAPGERALLFLWIDPGGAHRVVGGSHGKLPVTPDPSSGAPAVRGTPLADLLDDLTR
jgi:hypothetical protein